MSQSKETKTQSKAEREEKRRQEERADRRTMALYTLVGVVVVIAAVVLLVWNSGILQRTLTAVEVDGVKYTAADVEFYYNSTYNQIVNTYTSQYYTAPFDTSVSTKDQVYDEETGETWYDYLMGAALDSLTHDTALAKQAQAAGHALSAETQEALDSTLAQLDAGWIGYGYANRDAFIRANYGSHMTYNRLVELFQTQALAGDWAQAQLDAMEYTGEEYEAYYEEYADLLDTYTLSQFLIQARVETTDEDGNTIEMTDEEKAAALEEAKAEREPLVQELRERLEAGEDPEALAEEYADDLYLSSVNVSAAGSSISGYPYADWAMEAGRTAGDVTVEESESTTSCLYYVVLFQGRERDDSNTADVRHILVAAEQDEGADQPTQAQYDAAYAEAEELLEQWKAGEATEDSFAALAQEHSADTGSAANGGLITGISASSGYVETFADWALDPSRQPGDTGIVQNTGSSTKGWHIMYYVSAGDPIWKQTAFSAMQSEDYDQLLADIDESVTAQEGLGMKLVSGR